MTRGFQRGGTENTWRGKAKGKPVKFLSAKKARLQKIVSHITHGYPTGTWIEDSHVTCLFKKKRYFAVFLPAF